MEDESEQDMCICIRHDSQKHVHHIASARHPFVFFSSSYIRRATIFISAGFWCVWLRVTFPSFFSFSSSSFSFCSKKKGRQRSFHKQQRKLTHLLVARENSFQMTNWIWKPNMLIRPALDMTAILGYPRIPCA